MSGRTPVDDLLSKPVRKKLRLTNVRIASQVFFFGAFILMCWLTWTSRLEGYPVSRILEMDPLVMISTMLSTGYVYRYLGWGLLEYRVWASRSGLSQVGCHV